MYIKVSHEEAARLFARGRCIYDDIDWGTCFQICRPVHGYIKARKLRAYTRRMHRWDWNDGLWVFKKG